MSDTVNRKQERDFSLEIAALQPELESLAKQNQIQEALDKLTLLEKQTRNAGDLQSTSALLTLIPALTYSLPSTPSYDLLNSNLTLFSKKHGQLKEAVVRMVEKSMALLDELKAKGEVDGKNRWLELINTLRDITEGKIYLELQRARLTKMLAMYHEELAKSAPQTAPEGSKEKPKIITTDEDKEVKPEPATAQDHRDLAADLMSEIQVETYSSMDSREKTEFILEQMRLESERGLWPRVRVGGRKVNRGYLKESGNADMKLRYYELMIKLALQEDNYLDACKAWQEVWDTEEVKNNEQQNLQAMEHIIMFIVLAPYDNEQSDMIQKLYANAALKKCVQHYELLKSFITKELMRWPGVESLYGPTLRESDVFAPSSGAAGVEDAGTKRWENLHQRVIEHNIRVIASYYSQITLTRLTELLDLSPDAAERTLCKLVTDKTVRAKIDRPAGIVDFKQKQTADQTLNEWSGDLGKMLGLIEKTSHLINKEYAIHAARGAALA
ncbi:proteasome regulatory particle subunit [Naganishia albida]|nr:proteasome regulatory particle subunit [Naganishia albida]